MSKPNRRTPFRVEDAIIRAGSTADVDLRIMRLPDGTWTSMPIVVVHGRHDGPTVWISGAIHGDELNGIAIVRRLVKTINPRTFSGTLIAVPIVNVFGVTVGSRYLPDRRDLNRSFPGSARGSLAARLANLFFDRVVARSDLGLDFHTGSNGRANLPQIRCDLEHAEARQYALAFGAPITIHANLRDGSLRAAARASNIPVLLYEAGEALRLESEAIETGVAGTIRVMRHLGMLPDSGESGTPATRLAYRSTWIRAQRGGFCSVNVALGQSVQRGQPVATIADSLGHEEALIRSRTSGTVIAALRTALVYRGDAVVHVAELDHESP